MNIASKFGYKNTAKKTANKSSTSKPFRSSQRKIDWDLAHTNEDRSREYRLDRIQEIQHDIYQDVPEWSPEDKNLINFMWSSFKSDFFPVLGPFVWNQFIDIFSGGPRHPKVISGEFRSMLQHIRAILLQIK
jgi:hypothetical protein